jgi:hypothetical protein
MIAVTKLLVFKLLTRILIANPASAAAEGALQP